MSSISPTFLIDGGQLHSYIAGKLQLMSKSKNIVVATTDLSAASRAGIRFAMQLAELQKAELVILHVHYVLRASLWADAKYQHFIDQFEEVRLNELSEFTRPIFRSAKHMPPKHRLVVYHHADVVEGILKFANDHGATAICTSTVGQGGMARVFGSTVSSLVTRSNLPLICVPGNYRVKPIDHILYATDMERLEQEAKWVAGFAGSIRARMSAVHIAFEYESRAEVPKIQEKLSRKLKYPFQLSYEARDTDLSLLDSLRAVVKKMKPSLLVFFTNRKETFFQKLFTPNKAKEFAHHAQVPFVSIHKAAQ